LQSIGGRVDVADCFEAVAMHQVVGLATGLILRCENAAKRVATARPHRVQIQDGHMWGQQTSLEEDRDSRPGTSGPPQYRTFEDSIGQQQEDGIEPWRVPVPYGALAKWSNRVNDHGSVSSGHPWSQPILGFVKRVRTCFRLPLRANDSSGQALRGDPQAPRGARPSGAR